MQPGAVAAPAGVRVSTVGEFIRALMDCWHGFGFDLGDAAGVQPLQMSINSF